MQHLRGIHLTSQAAIFDIDAVLRDAGTDAPRAATPPIIQMLSGTVWANWGADNLLPLEIADDILNCGVLHAAMDAKARIATGKGMQPFLLLTVDENGKEVLEYAGDTEILDWMELNDSFGFGYDTSFDKHAYGWTVGSYVLNYAKNKIARIKRHDVYEARLEKQDPGSKLIKNIYLCSDWKLAGGQYDATKQVRLELLEEGNELSDLEERIAGNSNKLEFAFINRSLRNGAHYYPTPTHRSGKAWVKLARSIPAFKNAMFKNQITLKYRITIHPRFWTDTFGESEWQNFTADQQDEKRNEYYQKIDNWLSSEGNAYKSIFTGGFEHKHNKGEFVSYITVEAIDDKMKDGLWLPESGAANSEVLFAAQVNPSMMGAGNPGGKAYGDTSGGSNVRETFLVQIMTQEAERRLNASVFNVVKKFNGWSKRLEKERTFIPTVGAGQPTPQSRKITPRLVFRHPTGLLTTLDTGKSTKSENA